LPDLFSLTLCPPWNRIDQETTNICQEIGFTALSCFVKAPPLPAGMDDLSANVDFDKVIAAGENGSAIGIVQIADQLGAHGRATIMIHPTGATLASIPMLEILLSAFRAAGAILCLPSGQQSFSSL
jgi:hypothetical protein